MPVSAREDNSFKSEKVRPFVPGLHPVARGLLRLAGRAAPSLLAPLLERLFFTPLRHQPPQREAQWLRAARETQVQSAVGGIHVYEWSPNAAVLHRGPTVLLVHGWAGRAAQMGAIAVALSAHGSRVIAFDGPAHGKNPGRQTNALEFVAALHAVVETHGQPDLIITHSMGAFVAGIAMAGGLSVPKIAFIAPPPSLKEMTVAFAKMADLPEELVEHLQRRVENRVGRDIWRRFSTGHHTHLWQQHESEVLLIHDEEDMEAPIATAEAFVKEVSGARLHRTQGLGHRRIVRDKDVIRALVEFAQT